MARTGKPIGRPPKDEAPEVKLERVFAPRIARILDEMRQLPNMTRAEYGPPTPQHIEYVIDTIEDEFKKVKELLRSPDPKRLKVSFSFRDMGKKC